MMPTWRPVNERALIPRPRSSMASNATSPVRLSRAAYPFPADRGKTSLHGPASPSGQFHRSWPTRRRQGSGPCYENRRCVRPPDECVQCCRPTYPAVFLYDQGHRSRSRNKTGHQLGGIASPGLFSFCLRLFFSEPSRLLRLSGPFIEEVRGKRARQKTTPGGHPRFTEHRHAMSAQFRHPIKDRLPASFDRILQ